MGDWKPAHGRSKALGQTLVWDENARDERTSPPDGAGVSLDDGRDPDNGQIASSELARKMAKLRWSNVDYLPPAEQRTVKASGDFAAFNHQRQRRTKQRIGELLQLTGQVSSAIENRVRAAQWGYAFAEYFASKAAETVDLSESVKLSEKASALFAKASVEDEKAWRAACDEAKARPQQDPVDVLRQAALARVQPKEPRE